jgi:hypothetical protein
MGEAKAERTARARDREWMQHELRTALCVVVGREQLLRKRVLRGDPPAQIANEFEAMEAALLRLAAAVRRGDELGGGSADG